MIRINRNLSARQLRTFGLLWLLFFGFFAYRLWHTGWQTTGSALAAAALLVPLIGWWWLPLLRRAYLGLSYAVYPIGWLVSHLLLAIVYYGVLTPTGLGLRLLGKDLLQRRLDPQTKSNTASYWIERPPPPRPERYFRQF